jgi:hypothetical protein
MQLGRTPASIVLGETRDTIYLFIKSTGEISYRRALNKPKHQLTSISSVEAPDLGAGSCMVMLIWNLELLFDLPAKAEQPSSG